MLRRGREGGVLRCADQAGHLQPYKTGLKMLRTLMVQNGNKLQGCPELYRNLLLTAESRPGLMCLLLHSHYTPGHQPTQPVKDLARGGISPISFL